MAGGAGELRQSKKFVRTLTDGAMPVACRTLGEDDAARSRRFDCRRYDSCLDFAAANDWNGFSCDECPVDDRYPAATADHNTV